MNNVVAPPSSTFHPIQMHFAPLDNLTTSLTHTNNNIDMAIPLCLPCDDDTHTNNNNNNNLRHLSTLTPSSSSSSYGGGNNIGDGNRGPSGGSNGGCSPTPQNLRDNPERLAKVSTYYSSFYY
jgi:hypothetical protein